LRAAAQAPGRAAAPVLVLADDGEKFGIWSDTHKLCYEDGWLDGFFTALAAESDWLRVRTFAEVLDRTQPRGRTYLPTASYAEMMEWALPPAAQRGLHQALDRVDAGAAADSQGGANAPGTHDGDDLRLFVRGGFWRNFLAKYPESNWLHKRMLDVSRRVAATAHRRGDDHAAVRQAREALWKAQCNCAYWHGLFGGLYLPHLRGALYEQLLVAEAALATCEPLPSYELLDLDADRQPEIVLRSDAIQAFIKPDEGGAVFELDARRQHFNLLDVMTRREEAYHDRLRRFAAEVAAGGAAATAQNIHDIVAVKEPGLEQRLFYDVYRRGSFIDHALAADATIDRFVAATLPELAELAGAPYPWTRHAGGVRLERTTPLLVPGTPRLGVRKYLHLDGAALVADYELRQDGSAPAEFVFAVELAVNFRAGDASDRWFEVPGLALDDRRLGSTGATPGVRRFDAVDAWLGLRTVFTASVAAQVWRMPIETVSMSDGGFERVYQGSALLFCFPLQLAPGDTWTVRISQGVDAA
jgi:alpha-amylase